MSPRPSRSVCLSVVGLNLGLLVSVPSARALPLPCTVESSRVTTFAAASGSYHRAGAIVPLDRRSMVQVGQRGDVPIYTDTTLEPWSQLLIPVAGGWLQPYERRRDGHLAGTTGSRLPSFPVALAADDPFRGNSVDHAEGRAGMIVAMAQGPPVRPADVGAVRPAPCVAGAEDRRPTTNPRLVDEVPTARQAALVAVPLSAPDGNRGIWVPFEGATWRAEGMARLRARLALTPAGPMGTGVVYRLVNEPDAIYLPLREGTVTRFTRVRQAR